MSPRAVFSAVLVIGVVWSLVVAVATPPWEANDEPHHVRNVEALVAGRFYHITDEGSSMESHQPPLYYLLLAGWQRYVLRIASRPIVVNAAFFGPRNFRHDLPSDGADQRLVTLLRLVSVLLGAITVCLTRQGTALLTSDPWTPVVAAGFVVGVPKFVFLSGVVNNDNLSNALGAAVLLVTALLLARRTRLRAPLVAAGSGMLIGLLTLTKVSGALLAPAASLGLWFAAASRRERAALLGAFAASAAAVSGWWFVANALRYGDPLAASAIRSHLRAVAAVIFVVGSPAYQAFVAVPSSVFRSFWYTSGQNQLFWMSPYPYAALWVGLAAGTAGLARRHVPLPRPRGTLAVLGLAVLGGATAIWAVGVEASVAQARLGFFALPAVGALYALGVERWRLAVPLRFALPIAGIGLAWLAITEHVLGFFPS